MEEYITIILPIFNAQKTLGKCLNSLNNLNYPKERVEIIAIDDGSYDGTGEILKDYETIPPNPSLAKGGRGDLEKAFSEKTQRIKVIKTSRAGPSAARNLGIREAKGELVAFTDADCLVDTEWLNELLKGFQEDGRIVGVGGKQASPEDETSFGRLVHEYLHMMGFCGGYTKNINSMAKVLHNPSCNVIYWRKILLQAGGFMEGLFPGEDVELDRRLLLAGGELAYNPEAIVYHYRPYNIKGFARMMFSYGKWAGGYLWKKHGFFRLLYYEPFALLLVLAIIIGLSWYNIWWGVIALSGCLLIPFLLVLVKVRGFFKALNLWKLFLTTLLFWNLGFGAGTMVRIEKG